MRYADIIPISRRIPAARQEAKRHYGVHPYFTRRPYNVVRDYVLHYSKEGDLVLDPFGGSGVTAVEAYLENRTGVHNDINPFANFIVDSLVHLPDVSAGQAAAAFSQVENQCRVALKDTRVASKTPSLPPGTHLPPNVSLPSSSDVSTYHELFTQEQLRSLAILRHAIDSVGGPARSLLMLAWSGTLTRLNRTFISTNGRAESRGGSSIFSIYRYKVAKRPVSLDPWTVFENRFRGVMAARKELVDAMELKRSTGGWRGRFCCYDRDVVDLQREFKAGADYIFTDPPYGGHISYLDLSVLWNAWLGTLPSADARDKELIVGGERGFSEEHYTDHLYRSIAATFAMLKNGRWMSVVFQHWNMSYFRAILDAARDSGAALQAAVSQVGDPIWSMHKKKNRESVLAGELILTFFKGRTRSKTAVEATKSLHLEGMVDEILSELHHPVLYGEYLFNRIVVEAWRRGIIDELKVTREEFTALLEKRGWHYDRSSHLWSRAGRPSDGPIWDENEFRVADR